MSGLLDIIEQGESARRPFQCVEIYLPKRLKHLSELYDFLRNKVAQRLSGGNSGRARKEARAEEEGGAEQLTNFPTQRTDARWNPVRCGLAIMVVPST